MKAAVAVLFLVACSTVQRANSQACTNGDVRVTDGPSDTEGRAEICKNGVFNQICDDGWSQNDAKVFCSKLGASAYSAQAFGLSKYGSGGIPVDPTNYQCAGTEETLGSCTSSTGSNCGTDHIAGVKCAPKGACEAAGHTSCCISGCNAGGCYCDTACHGFGDCCSDIANTCPQGACTTNETRLFDGYTDSDGRVEYCINGQWTTICNSDNSWGIADAQVVCSQIGTPQSNPKVYTGPTPYGQGDQGITATGFQCTGSESSLVSCTHTSTGVDCGHQFDVGVDCNGACTNGDVLIYGANSTVGKVLLCVSGSWEYISDNGWGAEEAKVVCGAKGYSTVEYHAYGGIKYGQAKIKPTVTNFACFGNESSLSSCTYTTTSNGDIDGTAGIECLEQTTCEANGHTGCCLSGCNTGSCYCDSACHTFQDCCDGIERTCPASTCTEGDIRLVGGSSEYEGRVEVCINGKFGPICDTKWDDNDAKVVCGQLEYPVDGATAVTDSYFPESNLTIVASSFTCLGTESTLSDCEYGSSDCGHHNEAGVRCPEPCNNIGSIRLVGGNDNFDGRVEICEDGVWKSICQGNLWSQEDATVACSQLGYSTLAVVAYGDSHYGGGVGSIAATDLQCIGTEDYLYECTNTTENTCDHSSDVGVDCAASFGACHQAGFTTCCTSGCNVGSCYCDAACHGFGDCCEDIEGTCPLGSLTTCTNDDIRISGGDNTNQGLVELCIDEKWTSICDDGWGSEEAKVVCKEAGFSTVGAIAISGGYFGQTGGPIVKGNFQCTGNEANLADCTNSDSTCSQHKSAGVVCPESCSEDGAIRLISGDEMSGHVEVCTGGSWSAICDSNWCEESAKVVCGQLGYSTNRAEAYGASYFGQDVAPIQYTNVQCNGDESSITACSNSSTVPTTCNTKSLAGVKCFEKSQCEDNGFTSCCSSSCNVGGCYCDLACHTFQDCCDNIDNTCPSSSSCTNGLIRLVDGNDEFEGRLEMCVSGQWGTVCDEGFGQIDAEKACAQLKLPIDDVIIYDPAYFGQGDNPVVASGFLCTSADSIISDCGYSTDFCCGHHRDVSIRCNPGCNDGQIKLSGGSGDLEGTVKVCIKGGFYTICDDGWSNNDATVICRQLGYSVIGAQAFGKSHFENSSSVAYLTNVQCDGSESTWVGCSYSEDPQCGNSEFAGVQCDGLVGDCEAAGFTSCCIFGCNAGGCYCDAACHGFGDCCGDIEKICPNDVNCTAGETRIVNNFSNDQFSGRVEICVNGKWGSICDDGWGLNEAHVVCSQFGYTDYGSVPAPGAAFGQSSYKIVGGNFTCNGLESTIHDCSYDASPDCGHHQDAGVYCNVKCGDGDVRMVNSSSEYQGRVEVCMNGTWHPVCDSLWTTEDAIVVCRQLGYSTLGAQAFGHSYFGNGITTPMAYGYNCSGSETNLTNCVTIPSSMCDAESTAGVICQGEVSQCEAAGHTGCCISGCNAGGCYCDEVCHSFGDCCDNIDITCPQSVCTNGDIRLVGGVTEFRGRVETCVNGQWGTICDDGWTDNDAVVVCSQAGHALNGARAVGGAQFGQGTDSIVAGNFQCVGNEDTLLECPYTAGPSCGHHQDAGVICPEKCENNGDIRITDGPSAREGRVEVCLNSQWSSVCADDILCDKSASVLCKNLGYSAINAEAYGLAKYGEGGGFVGIEAVNCLGTESNLTQCQYTIGSSCPHSKDAGVKCQPISPCEQLGHTECCTTGCYNFQHFCWCDAVCHFFNDCCDNIDATCPESTCTDGEKRFVNGNDTSGILNICYDSQWHTVCDLDFGDVEARVACKAQGLDEKGYTIHSVETYGQGEGKVFAKELKCTGSEFSLNDCPGNEGCCSHNRDIGLTCQYACSEGEIRLVGGSNYTEGRVEVCLNGRWGTVCDDLWGEDDARVACKMAGFPWRGAVATSLASFGQGVGPIHLDNVDCDGSEGTLWNCSSIVSNHNCAHFEDAGVICGPCELAGYTDGCCDKSKNDCQGKQESEVCHCDSECELHGDCCVDFDLICRCKENEIRLINGANEREGRLEICIDGQFGTVCDDLFGISDGQVVCRQLGYPDSSIETFNFAYFGQGTGPILLDNVGCVGNESYLINCSSNGVGVHNCFHFEDVGVRCAPSTCSNGDTRLEDGDSQFAGRLEVCLNGLWGTVCDDLFSNVDAAVACKSLNLPSENAFWFRSQISFPATTGPINMDNVQCTGTEAHITDCPFVANHNCFHFEDVAVVCNPGCAYNGQLRLTRGTDNTNGRLEVCTDGTWGTVCDDFFDNQDAKVACRQLGLPTGSARSLLNLQYGRGYGPIKYSQLGCTGNETHLNNCTKFVSGFFCSHAEDVGISCEPSCVDGQMKLVGGKLPTEGRVEICRGGVWGTICDNSGSWGIHEARVTCRQLGFPTTAAQAQSFGAGGEPIQYSNVDCDGSELNLASCNKILNNDDITCTHTQDVGVTCEEACTFGEVRLIDGTDSSNGRFEICLGGVWGTVCDEEFHNEDAKIVCKQLGLEYMGAEAVFGGVFGYGEDSVAITNLHCEGTENAITECFFTTGSDVSSCSHANDVGIICQGLCSNGDIRLANGASAVADAPPSSGRVEVCFNGEWGTVCEDGWSTKDAQVVCGQLGFDPSAVRTFGGSKYGSGIGEIYYKSVSCTGTETCLVTCPASTDTSSCTHDDDAGVRCDGEFTHSDLPVDEKCPPSCNLPPPGIITNVTLDIDTNTTKVELRWEEPTITNGIITGYKFTVEGQSTLNRDISGGSPKYIKFDALETGVPYIYSLVALNLCGAGKAYTDTFFTGEKSPNSPTIISAGRTAGKEMRVSWAAMSLQDVRGYLSGFELSWAKDTSSSEYSKIELAFDTLQYNIRDNNIEVDKEYKIRVRAKNGVGYGQYSDEQTVSTTNYVYVQVKLFLLANQKCGVWLEDSGSNKLTDLIKEVSDGVASSCKCGFSSEYLVGGFQCNPTEDQEVHFRGQLFSTSEIINASDIAGNITSWLSTNPKVTVDGAVFDVDPDCRVVINDLSDDYCRTSRPSAASNAAVIGGSVVASVFIIIFFAALIIIVVLLVMRVQRGPKYGSGDASHEMVGYSNQMAFPEGTEDNISQRAHSTIHDDDFQQAINMISDEVDMDMEKRKLADEMEGEYDKSHVYFSGDKS